MTPADLARIAGVYLVLTSTTMQLWCIGTVPISTACIFDVLLIQ